MDSNEMCGKIYSMLKNLKLKFSLGKLPLFFVFVNFMQTKIINKRKVKNLFVKSDYCSLPYFSISRVFKQLCLIKFLTKIKN